MTALGRLASVLLPMRVDIHLHVEQSQGPEVMALLKRILAIGEKQMAAIEDLKAVVEQDTSVTGSAVALLEGLKAKLDEALAGGNLEADVKDLAAKLQSNTDALAAAVSANTPAEEEEPSEPTP